MAAKTLPSCEELHKFLRYDAETGAFTWRPRAVEDFCARRPAHREHLCRVWNENYAGKSAGKLHSRGYWALTIREKTYLAHRVAWLMQTGDQPPDQIDHVDGNRLNNRFSNLRLATNAQNNANKAKLAANTSGFKGVSFMRKSGKWRAVIRVRGQFKHLGSFSDPAEAHEAYCRAAEGAYGAFFRSE